MIEDDGQAFDRTRTSGFGMQGMRERVTLLDGRLQIESAEQTGTTLVVEVPLA